LRQLCQHRPAFRRGVEIAQRGDFTQGHQVGHDLRLVPHEGRHRIGEGVEVKLSDLCDLIFGQRLPACRHLLKDRLVHRLDHGGHIEALQRKVDIFGGHRNAFVPGLGQNGIWQGKKRCQQKRSQRNYPFQIQPPP
jgi:hypothetical protein